MSILEKTGVRVYSEKARRLLASYGAEVVGDIVRIPHSLVKESLKRAPKEILLAARDPKYDLRIPTKDFPYIAPSGTAVYLYDLETGIKRPSLSSDLRDFAILSDYLDTVNFFWPIVCPTDKPPVLQRLYALFISLVNCRKHVQEGFLTEETAKWGIELASVIVGGREELKRRPIFSSINCPIAPLTFERGNTDAMMILARAGIPIAPMSMCLAGSTAPATLAGALAVANAEQLASLTIVQCSSPSAPMIYSLEISAMDKMTGEINYTAPEFTLLCAAGSQMAKFYGLPSLTSDVPLEVMPVDILSFERNVLKVAMHLMAPTDLSSWLGSLDRAKGASLPQLLLDAEVCEHAKAYLRRFEVSDETLALNVIDKVGPSGHFLAEKHTAKHFRREIWTRDLSDTFYLDPGEGSYLERARKKIKEILSTHSVPIEKDLAKEMEKVLQAAEKEIMSKRI